MKCPYCDKFSETFYGLAVHCRMHQITPEKLYIKLYGRPTCKCGCGQLTTWKGNKYADYIRGHIARITNNWGHNPTAIVNSAKTRREKYIEPWNKGKKGVQVGWNKGLTKETDERVKKISESHKKIKENIPYHEVKRLTEMSRTYWSKQKNKDDQSERSRIALIKRIKNRKGQIAPNYNPKACRLIEEYGKKHNFNFRHAENGGEVCIGGYYPDGIDIDAKVIIEVDEAYHYKNGELHYKDVKRQKYLEKKGYTVIRLKI